MLTTWAVAKAEDVSGRTCCKTRDAQPGSWLVIAINGKAISVLDETAEAGGLSLRAYQFSDQI